MFPLYLTIFVVSLFTISFELFLTNILSLKTWNHLVYLIIPFAMLGYGIGANIYLLFKQKIDAYEEKNVLAATLILTGILGPLNIWALAGVNVQIEDVFHIFSRFDAILNLLSAYSIVFLPFIPIGFLVVYLFSVRPKASSRLYFVDLLGAGTGAFVFVALIYRLGVFPSIIALAAIMLALGVFFLLSKHQLVGAAAVLMIGLCWANVVVEPKYVIDSDKGWEDFEGNYRKDQYETLVSAWSPLGRSDIHRVTDRALRATMVGNAYFKINLTKIPEFSYATANVVAGTPIFKFSDVGKTKDGPQINLFSQVFEVPYLLGKKEKMVVIGAGGGRDIFIAKSHGVQSIDAAEINPIFYKSMTPGGKLYEYSGKIYTAPGVDVNNVDGRHLVKTLPADTFDLIMLTGVDTFSGLTNGAYTYAESYLYTKNALLDYLRILNANGILDFNRRYFPAKPREDLRLFALSLDALKETGVPSAWDNVLVGVYQQWAVILVRKTAFMPEEIQSVRTYFKSHSAELYFPQDHWQQKSEKEANAFEQYAQAFMRGKVPEFERAYPYDVSVITDNKPFFYKYYKFNILDPLFLEYDRHTGTLIFITQIAVLGQALFFIGLFIFLPLWKLKGMDIQQLPRKSILPFVIYFACLGVGFMFIEIPLMQKFVLLLGSPIYSVAVTLTVLLISAGIGSYLLNQPVIAKLFPHYMLMALVLLVVLVMGYGSSFLNHFIGAPFWLRAGAVSAVIVPIGLVLGLFFPSGLALIGTRYASAISWAWALNSGFSVLGSILSITLAQFLGFKFVLTLALLCYVLAAICFRKLAHNLV